MNTTTRNLDPHAREEFWTKAVFFAAFSPMFLALGVTAAMWLAGTFG